MGVDPSVDPLVYVSFNESWQPYIVGVIETLLDEDTWEGTAEEQYEAYCQVIEIIARFVDGSMISYPFVQFIPIHLFKFNGGANPWIYFFRDSQFLNGAWYQMTATLGDWWSFEFPHKAGSYQFVLWGIKGPNVGKTKLRVNGVYDEGSLFDWYAAAYADNVVQTRAVSFAQDGRQIIDIFVPEKNPLSSAYFVNLSSFAVY